MEYVTPATWRFLLRCTGLGVIQGSYRGYAGSTGNQVENNMEIKWTLPMRVCITFTSCMTPSALCLWKSAKIVYIDLARFCY